MTIPVLTRSRFTFWEQFRECVVYSCDEADRNYHIYLPDKFVFGNFKERSGEFKLNGHDIHYEDSPKILNEYKKSIEDKKVEIVKSLTLSKDMLETIMKQGRICVDAKNSLSKMVKNLS